MIIVDGTFTDYQETSTILTFKDVKEHNIQVVVRCDKKDLVPFEINFKTSKVVRANSKTEELIPSGQLIWRNGRIDVNTLKYRWQIDKALRILELMEVSFERAELL